MIRAGRFMPDTGSSDHAGWGEGARPDRAWPERVRRAPAGHEASATAAHRGPFTRPACSLDWAAPWSDDGERLNEPQFQRWRPRKPRTPSQRKTRPMCTNCCTASTSRSVLCAMYSSNSFHHFGTIIHKFNKIYFCRKLGCAEVLQPRVYSTSIPIAMLHWFLHLTEMTE